MEWVYINYVVNVCNSRLRFNLRNARVKIHIKRFLGSLSIIESGTNVQDGKQKQGKVVGDEGRGEPVSFDEDSKPTKLQANLWFRPIHANP